MPSFSDSININQYDLIVIFILIQVFFLILPFEVFHFPINLIHFCWVHIFREKYII